MIQRVTELALGYPEGRLELQLVGGYSDPRNYSEELFYNILCTWKYISDVFLFICDSTNLIFNLPAELIIPIPPFLSLLNSSFICFVRNKKSIGIESNFHDILFSNDWIVLKIKRNCRHRLWNANRTDLVF